MNFPSETLFSRLKTMPHRMIIIILMALTLLCSLPGLSSIQVIDRDEARYAQATVQMVETGDYVDIRFQDAPRHKKPVGIYWAQAASVKLFTSPSQRRIWAHRIISVIAGLLAVIGTYWAGLALYNRRYAFIAAALLSVSLLFIFESHIAKTDAAICACAAWIIGALLRLRLQAYLPRQTQYGIVFWLALALAILIKGPIIPLILTLCLITISIGDKISGQSLDWLWRLVNPIGVGLFGLILLPWFIMIYKATDGAFYSTAFGGDLAPKIAGVQESHGGPFGYYSLVIWATLWPASALLPLAATYGFKRTKAAPHSSIAFLCAWIVPFWIMLEIVPTKLSHYNLPLFPAITLLISSAISYLATKDDFRRTRQIGAVIFLIISIALVAVVMFAEASYGLGRFILFFPAILAVFAAIYSFIKLWAGQIEPALIGIGLTAIILSMTTYGLIMPKLNTLRLADNIAVTLTDKNIKLPRDGGPMIRSPHFAEPSLVYNLGSQILLSSDADHWPYRSGDIWIIDKNKADAKKRLNSLQATANANQLCLIELGQVDGLNYSKGDEARLALLSIRDCQ